MANFKLMIVENGKMGFSEQDLQLCRDCINDFKNEKSRKIEIVECKTVDEAVKKIDKSYDGAIIDLKLSSEGNEGNQVIEFIENLHLRIPIVILTATPGTADENFAYIGVFKKGELGSSYNELLEKLWNIHNTGLTRIMGGRGIIEDTLDKVFMKNLLPQKDKWITYGLADSPRTEKALLRHTLNHLVQLLEHDEKNSFPEEMYLFPPLNEELHNGSIVRDVHNNKYFIILNPVCDLVLRENGQFKTDRILLVEVENSDDIIKIALNGIVKTQKIKDKLTSLYSNNYSFYYHWLPKTDFFIGGFINFRKLSTITSDDIKNQFSKPFIQISAPFIKDIVARFSSYYARQGQPDIDFSQFIE